MRRYFGVTLEPRAKCCPVTGLVRGQLTNRGFRTGLSSLPEIEGNSFSAVIEQIMVNSTAVEGPQ